MGFWLVFLKSMASISSVVMCLSPSPSIYRIHKQQSTGVVLVPPLVSFFFNCYVCVIYGIVTGNYFPIVVTYSIGFALSLVYLGVYFRWTPERAYVAKLIMLAVVVMAAATVYTILGKAGYTGQSSSDVNDVVGYMTAAASVLMYASPLEVIKKVITTKSAAPIPIALCLAGTICNTLWVIYGLVIDDFFVFFLGVVCAVLGAIQVVLYMLYNPARIAEGHTLTAPAVNGTNSKYELPVSVQETRYQTSSPCFESMSSPLASRV